MAKRQTTARSAADPVPASATVEGLRADTVGWWRKAVLNTARMGWFSSDRTVRDYARQVWRVPLET